MKKQLACSYQRFYLLALLLAVCAPAQLVAQSIRFHIRVAPELSSTPVSGRMIVFLSSEKEPKKELSQGFADTTNQVWIAAQEIHDARPGETIDVDPDLVAFPNPLSQAPAGDYQAMALLDVNHNYAYRGARPGDLRSAVVVLKGLNPSSSQPVDLVLTERIPEKEIKPPASSEMLDFASPALSSFWGRPIHMRGVVVLPPNYEQNKTQKYPTVYWTHGFGGILDDLAQRVAPMYSGLMTQGKIPPMIYVLLDESCPGGTHEFADSVNNGPWGKALTTELIPYLEKKYRMDGKPSGRLLTGHSSGGWAALWLQVAYPTVFGGTWPTSPDPSDFHSFTGPDLRANANFYHKQDGSPWMLVRVGGHDVMALEDYARQEAILGEYGGQISSFDWVFSPRGKDGRPEPLFDRATGVVDPEVAKAWEKYDVAEVLRKNAARLRPLLQGKIHLTVGTADTFHLDEAAHLLDATMKELGIRAKFTYLEGRTHFDLYQGGLTEKIANEMEQVARGKGVGNREQAIGNRP